MIATLRKYKHHCSVLIEDEDHHSVEYICSTEQDARRYAKEQGIETFRQEMAICPSCFAQISIAELGGDPFAICPYCEREVEWRAVD